MRATSAEPLFKSTSDASDLSVGAVPNKLASINSSRPAATINGWPLGKANSRRVPSSKCPGRSARLVAHRHRLKEGGGAALNTLSE